MWGGVSRARREQYESNRGCESERGSGGIRSGDGSFIIGGGGGAEAAVERLTIGERPRFSAVDSPLRPTAVVRERL